MLQFINKPTFLRKTRDSSVDSHSSGHSSIDEADVSEKHQKLVTKAKIEQEYYDKFDTNERIDQFLSKEKENDDEEETSEKDMIDDDNDDNDDNDDMDDVNEDHNIDNKTVIPGFNTPKMHDLINQENSLQNEWNLWYIDYNNKLDTHHGNQPTWKPVQIASFVTVEQFWFVVNRVKSPSSLQPKVDFALFRHGIDPKFEDINNQFGGSWKMISDKKANKMNNVSRRLVDFIWLETLMLLVGENFWMPKNPKKNSYNQNRPKDIDSNDDSNNNNSQKENIAKYVNGCYLQIRPKEDRITIWTSLGMKKDEREKMNRKKKLEKSKFLKNPEDENQTISIDFRSDQENEKILKHIGHTFKESINVSNSTKISFSTHEDTYNPAPNPTPRDIHLQKNQNQSYRRKLVNNVRYIV